MGNHAMWMFPMQEALTVGIMTRVSLPQDRQAPHRMYDPDQSL
jgi:hypothetical protein